MPARAMNLKDFRGYIKKLGKKLVGHDGAVVRGIHSGLMRSISIVQQATTTAFPASPNGSEGAVNTGAYRQAWQVEKTPTGGRIFNTAPYAGVIEYGRRAGAKRPPTKAIELWAMRKLGLNAKEAKSASFAIANAIKKRGLAPRKVLTSTRTESAITLAVMQEIRAEVKAALRRGGK